MDPGRYGRQQRWENNSDFNGYGAVHEANYRFGGDYDDRRFVGERYSRDNIHPRNAFHRDMSGRENYPPSSVVDPWPQTRRRSHENEIDRYQDYDKLRDGYRGTDSSRGYGNDRSSRYGSREPDNYGYDDYEYKSCSRERDSDYDRRSYDSDYERGSRRESSWKSREPRDRDHEKRGLSRELNRSRSPRVFERSRSRGRDDRYRSRSPQGRSHGRDYREDSYDDGRYERGERRRDREYSHESVQTPSATLVVKGLSQKTTEEDLYQNLAEWGPIQQIRVIKERDSGISRGFAFMDFPSVDAARALMDKVGDDGLVVDGRKLFFQYSSKPSGGAVSGSDHTFKSGQSSHRSMIVPSDWMCTICSCNNFARRTSCFQCNEPRTDDAPSVSSHSNTMGKKGDAGPTHVLVVRGLDENADEEMLRYEFSKHAPIKDIRLVRDKFTHVSRGFAFVHFHTVEDATKALQATTGTTLERNGQILRVAYAKSVLGSGSGPSGSSSLAAAAIEAAAFSQQYDAVGWAPKEYNPDEKQSTGQEPSAGAVDSSKNASAPQSGFVWDEASGYYYDATSGFYYDGNTGLYYDGNNGLWYTFDQQTQQYVPCTDQNDKKVDEKQTETQKAADSSTGRKVVISAPAATITSSEKASLPDAVQAAANAAMAAEKKEKERLKEIRLASKNSILANKKKMNNVLTMWKQRSVEGQAPRVALAGNQPAAASDDRSNSNVAPTKNRYKSETVTIKENPTTNTGFTPTTSIESEEKPRPAASNSSGGTIMGVIRGSGRGVVKSDTTYSGPVGVSLSTSTDAPTNATPFRTDLSALGSYTSPVTAGSGKRRFSEMPVQPAPVAREQPQTGYRDRAAERRSLYGSSSSLGDDISDHAAGNSNRGSGYKRSLADPTPFPPGVGGGHGSGEATVESYEGATIEKAIDENNVGNRMLRNMGWQEGLGLGKDGSGMIEPVQAQAVEKRAGLGSQQKKPTDPNLQVHASDSYRTVIQKKAIARFREME